MLAIMASSNDISEPEFVLDKQPYQFEPLAINRIPETKDKTNRTKVEMMITITVVLEIWHKLHTFISFKDLGLS